MSENIRRIGSEIICNSRTEDSSCIIAQVRLRYSVLNHGASEMTSRVELIEGKGDRWRKTKRRIIANAWEWLEEYFDGARSGSDQVNIFKDLFADNIVSPSEQANPESSLSRAEELGFTKELAKIEHEFRHAD
jgi:hypothetical protein